MLPTLQTTAPAFCSVTSAVANTRFNIEDMRACFPILEKNPERIFFDNASTTHKPVEVLEAINSFNTAACSNAGRGSYSWSTKLSRQVEECRSEIADLLNTEATLVAFTAGATDSLNLVASSWGLSNLKDGDQVMVCAEDHQSAVLPWYNVKAMLHQFGVKIDIVTFAMHPTGTYDRKSISDALSEKTRLICFSHIHHVFGMEMDLPELRRLIPSSVLISLDASQSAGHITIDAKRLDVDFISFSGHKMFASNGTGVLWTSPRALEGLWPSRVGAKTKIKQTENGLEVDRSSLANLIECGTLNLPGILSMTTASRFLKEARTNGSEEYISELTKYLVRRLKNVPGMQFAPGIGVCDCTKGYGIVSFSIDGLRSGDIGAYLDSHDIFVRTGDHCLAKHDPQKADLMRISLQLYNTIEEVDRFVEVLADACF